MEQTLLEKIPPEAEEMEEAEDERAGPDAGDEAILDLFFARDETALEACRVKYGGRCRAAAENILGSAEDAEECVNDVWLRAWNAIPPERPRFLGAYLTAVARRLALDRWRTENAEKRGGGGVRLCLDELAECVGDGDGWDEDGREALRDALNRWLAGEPKAARKLFLLRYWYAYPVREAARLCGISEGAAKMSLSRAKKRLRAHLEKEGFSV